MVKNKRLRILNRDILVTDIIDAIRIFWFLLTLILTLIPKFFLWFLIVLIAIIYPYRRHGYSVSKVYALNEEDLERSLHNGIAVKGKQPVLSSIVSIQEQKGEYFITWKHYWSLSKQISHNYWGYMNKTDEYPKTYFFCYLAFYVIFGILTHIFFPNVTEYLWEQIEYLNLV